MHFNWMRQIAGAIWARRIYSHIHIVAHTQNEYIHVYEDYTQKP